MPGSPRTVPPWASYGHHCDSPTWGRFGGGDAPPVPHLRQGENALITRNVVLTFLLSTPAEKIAFADWAWRYDVLRPNDDFSHWDAVGHANSDTFEFTMDLQKP